MSKESDIEEEEPGVKRGAYNNIVNAFDYFLSNAQHKGVIGDILDDLAPRFSLNMIDGVEARVAQAPKGLRVGSVFKVIGLFITHPVHTINMIRFATNPVKYNTPETHRAILSNESTWNFVQDTGGKLDQVGALLGHWGVKEFQEGAILDQEALGSLKEVFNEPENLADMKSAALAARADIPEPLKALQPITNMLARDARFAQYFQNKGSKIQDLIMSTVKDQVAKNPDIVEKMASVGISQDQIRSLTDIVPVLLEKPVVFKKVVDSLVEADYPGMVKELLANVADTPEISEYLSANRDIFVGVINSVIKQVPQLEGMGLRGELYDIVPTLLSHPDKLIEIIEAGQNFQFEQAGSIFFEIAKTDDRMQEFFADHAESLTGAALEAAGLQNYKIGSEVGEILQHFMKGDNAPKFQKLMEKFNQGEWLGLVKGLCSVMEEDIEFKQYAQDNKRNFSKIVKVALDNLPEVRVGLKGTKVSKLVGLIISDPASARELIEGIEQGKIMGAYAVAKFAVNNAMNPEVRRAVGQTIIGLMSGNDTIDWLLGNSNQKQEVVSVVTDLLSSRDADERVNLTDFIQASFDEISRDVEGGLQEKMQKQIVRKKFFDGAKIIGTRFDKVNLSNIDVAGNQFVNTKIEHVSFENSDFTNSAFYGAKFEDVSFAGAKIDGFTLDGMLPSFRSGDISLEGVQLVGQLGKAMQGIVQQDLTYMSFDGADLSGVTSFKGIKLDGADFNGAILPEDPMLLSDSYGLEYAHFPEGYITEEVMIANMERIAEKSADSAINRANGKGEHLSEQQEQILRSEVDRVYKMDNIIGEKFRQSLQDAPPMMDMYAVRAPEFNAKKELLGISDIRYYKGTTANALETIFANKHGAENLESTLVAHHIADAISERLFKEGNNRGEDGIAIRNGIEEAVLKYVAQHDSIEPMSLLETEQYEEMVGVITKNILEKVYPTALGRVEKIAKFGNSDRIQLQDNSFGEDLVEAIKQQMNFDAGVLELNDQEVEVIEEIADSIAKNIFGSGIKGSREADAEMIYDGLYDVIYELKIENNAFDLSTALIDKKDELVGTKKEGGLAKTYFDAADNTWANTFSFGMKEGKQFDEKKIYSHEFLSIVKETIEIAVADAFIQEQEIETIQQIQPKEKKKFADKIQSKKRSGSLAQDVIEQSGGKERSGTHVDKVGEARKEAEGTKERQ